MKLMNDRKRKSSISAETCLEKFVKTHQVELNFWRFSIICNHCVPGGGGGSAAPPPVAAAGSLAVVTSSSAKLSSVNCKPKA